MACPSTLYGHAADVPREACELGHRMSFDVVQTVGWVHMQVQNPYDPAGDTARRALSANKAASRTRWTATGFIIGAALPLSLGAYGIYNERLHYASLPPGTAACGMGALAAFMFIVVFGPLGGLVGAATGWIVSGFRSR